MLNDGRPNNERLLATGMNQNPNESDFLLYEAKLVKSDKLFSTKREVLAAAGWQVRRSTLCQHCANNGVASMRCVLCKLCNAVCCSVAAACLRRTC